MPSRPQYGGVSCIDPNRDRTRCRVVSGDVGLSRHRGSSAQGKPRTDAVDVRLDEPGPLATRASLQTSMLPAPRLQQAGSRQQHTPCVLVLEVRRVTSHFQLVNHDPTTAAHTCCLVCLLDAPARMRWTGDVFW